MSIPLTPGSTLLKFGRMPTPQEWIQIKQLTKEHWSEQDMEKLTANNTVVVVKEKTCSAVLDFLKDIIFGELFADVWRSFSTLWKNRTNPQGITLFLWQKHSSEKRSLAMFDSWKQHAATNAGTKVVLLSPRDLLLQTTFHVRK